MPSKGRHTDVDFEFGHCYSIPHLGSGTVIMARRILTRGELDLADPKNQDQRWKIVDLSEAEGQ
jgi:hypothetical protein